LRFARQVRALKNVKAGDMRALEKALEVTHRLAREALAQFLITGIRYR